MINAQSKCWHKTANETHAHTLAWKKVSGVFWTRALVSTSRKSVLLKYRMQLTLNENQNEQTTLHINFQLPRSLHGLKTHSYFPSLVRWTEFIFKETENLIQIKNIFFKIKNNEIFVQSTESVWHILKDSDLGQTH